jgi:hypothetical protein
MGPGEPQSGPREVGGDDATRLVLDLWLTREEQAEFHALLSDFFRRRRSAKLPQSAPVAPTTSVEGAQPVEPAPKPETTRPPRNDSAIRAGWTQIEETCQYTLQLPKGHLMGAQGAWIALHAVPGEAPTGDQVVEGLRVMGPQWKAKAQESGSWQFVPLLKNWLKNRGWEFAAPPAPVPGDTAPRPILGPEAKEAIAVARTKGNAAVAKGDFGMAKTYREQIKRIEQTGRVA